MSRRAVAVWTTVAALGALSFAELTREVVGHTGLARIDPQVTTFIATHRVGGLAVVLGVLTWLGSGFVIVPLGLAIGGYLFARRGSLQPLVLLAAALGGAAALYEIFKPLVGRYRPAGPLQYGPPDLGWAFPSGHSTQSVSFYGMLGFVLITTYAPQRKVPIGLAVAAIALLIGLSRLYLGVHWLTDVLGGWALGLTWLAILILCQAATGSGVVRRWSGGP